MVKQGCDKERNGTRKGRGAGGNLRVGCILNSSGRVCRCGVNTGGTANYAWDQMETESRKTWGIFPPSATGDRDGLWKRERGGGGVPRLEAIQRVVFKLFE